MDAPNGLKAGNVYAMILAFALMLLAFCYWAGRKSVHCAPHDPTAQEALRATVAAQEAALADAHAESERLRAIIDSAEAAPKPTIKSRVNDAYRSIDGSPVRALVERLDAAPDSL